jgi:hypothetical protein
MTPADFSRFHCPYPRLCRQRGKDPDRPRRRDDQDRRGAAPADRDIVEGLQARVGVAQALLHDPDVLILDEPTDGST